MFARWLQKNAHTPNVAEDEMPKDDAVPNQVGKQQKTDTKTPSNK